jgi:hypothetical protein
MAAQPPQGRGFVYRTPSGKSPVVDDVDAIMKQSEDDATNIWAAWAEVLERKSRAKKLRGDLWEIRAPGERQSYRLVVAFEAGTPIFLHVFSKKRQKTAKTDIDLAQKRLTDYRRQVRG